MTLSATTDNIISSTTAFQYKLGNSILFERDIKRSRSLFATAVCITLFERGVCFELPRESRGDLVVSRQSAVWYGCTSYEHELITHFVPASVGANAGIFLPLLKIHEVNHQYIENFLAVKLPITGDTGARFSALSIRLRKSNICTSYPHQLAMTRVFLCVVTAPLRERLQRMGSRLDQLIRNRTGGFVVDEDRRTSNGVSPSEGHHEKFCAVTTPIKGGQIKAIFSYI